MGEVCAFSEHPRHLRSVKTRLLGLIAPRLRSVAHLRQPKRPPQVLRIGQGSDRIRLCECTLSKDGPCTLREARRIPLARR